MIDESPGVTHAPSERLDISVAANASFRSLTHAIDPVGTLENGSKVASRWTACSRSRRTRKGTSCGTRRYARFPRKRHTPERARQRSRPTIVASRRWMLMTVRVDLSSPRFSECLERVKGIEPPYSAWKSGAHARFSKRASDKPKPNNP